MYVPFLSGFAMCSSGNFCAFLSDNCSECLDFLHELVPNMSCEGHETCIRCRIWIP